MKAMKAMKAMERAISKVDAHVGVAARQFGGGREILHNADERFVLASAFKIPVLVELYRQVDAGGINLSERVEIADALRVPGSGVLKQLASGLRPTLYDLAMLMIVVSDNTATDILFDRLGSDRINATLNELGLPNTHIPMACRGLLLSLVGLDERNPEHTFEMAKERLDRGEFVENPDCMDVEKSGSSTARDMIRLMELIERGEILSAESRDAALTILKAQQYNTIIPAGLPMGTKSAHKTGHLRDARTDVGTVYAPSGPYAVAILARDATVDKIALDAQLAGVSRAVYETFEEH